MPHRATPHRSSGLLPLATTGALWTELLADTAVPASPEAFSAPAYPPAGYVLLGGRAVPTLKAANRQWYVPEADVRRAAAELAAVAVNAEDLVRVGPIRRPQQPHQQHTPALQWRLRIDQHVRDYPGQVRQPDGAQLLHPAHLAGIDWRQVLMQRPWNSAHTWWLPRGVVKVLDAAEHAEAAWLKAARTCQGCGAVADQSHLWRVQDDSGWQTICPHCRTTAPRPYNGELDGQLYSALSKKRGNMAEASGWTCAVCQEAPATVLDHCHEHGYVRAPVCQSCNTRERPEYLYSNNVTVTNRYTHLFHTGADQWLKHWHRCPGCRARNTLPLPHLAALTAVLIGERLRPTHRDPRSSRARKPCGELRASWTGSHYTPASCVITVSVNFCPTGEHRTLAQVPYRQAVERFRNWLATTAPTVASAAGPGRHDSILTQFRPVIPDTNSESQALF